MADIKLTLSQNKALRSPSIDEEAGWMEQEGPIYYTLGANRPLHAEAGCWVYLIRGGGLVARAKADEIRQRDNLEDRYTYTGVATSTKEGVWEVACRRMYKAHERLPLEGFQGFRYVTDEEQEAFEGAFLAPER